MNFGEMKYKLRRISGESTDDTKSYYGSITCSIFLNAAAIHVASIIQPSMTYWPMATIAYDNPALAPDANEREGRYPLPAAIISVKGVEILSGTEWRQLEVLGFDDFNLRYGITTYAGEPEAYMVQFGEVNNIGSPKGDFWLGPKPNGVFQFRVSGYKLPTPINPTDDGKTYEVQEPFHDAIVYYAAMNLVIGNDDKSRFLTFKAMYEQSMQAGLNIVGRRDRTGGFSTLRKAVRTKSSQRRVR